MQCAETTLYLDIDLTPAGIGTDTVLQQFSNRQ